MGLTESRHPRSLFSIFTAMGILTAAGIFLAAARTGHELQIRQTVPAAFILSAYIAAACARTPDLAWGFITTAWLWTGIDVIFGLMDCFQRIDGPPPVAIMQAELWRACYVPIAIPLALSVPAVYFAYRASQESHFQRGWKLMATSPVITLADIILVTILLIVLFAHSGPW